MYTTLYLAATLRYVFTTLCATSAHTLTHTLSTHTRTRTHTRKCTGLSWYTPTYCQLLYQPCTYTRPQRYCCDKQCDKIPAVPEERTCTVDKKEYTVGVAYDIKLKGKKVHVHARLCAFTLACASISAFPIIRPHMYMRLCSCLSA